MGMKPALDPSEPLLAFDYRTSPWEVRMRMIVGAVAILAVGIVYLGFGSEAGFFAAITFGLIGMANLVLGLLSWRFEKSMLFTGHDVQVKTRGLLGRREWREPLANFRGVRLHEHHSRDQGVGTIASTKTYHVIELVHDSPRRTLPLYVRRGAESPRDIQEAFARRFDLPALAPDSGGDAARSVDALNTPISDLPAADPGPPPSGVRIRKQRDATRITIGQGRIGALLAVLFWLSIPVMFGGIGFMLDPQAGLMAGGMAVLFVAIMLGLARLVGGKSRKQESALVLEPDRIWIDRPQRDEWLSRLGRRILSAISGRQIEAGERPEETIARQAIEQIRVDTYTSHYSGTSSSSGHGGSTVHDRLVIEGDGGRIAYIGNQFDKRKLEWVRDYLRFQLAAG